MKVSQILACLAFGATAISALPTEAVEDAADITNVEDIANVADNTNAGGNVLEASANLPGLNSLQSKYASAIIAQAKKDGVGAHGCQAGIATAMVEVLNPMRLGENYLVRTY